MIILEHDQGTPEWLQDRIGVPTASQFSNIVTCKGERSKQRTKYLYRLAAEKITGTREESYQNAAMLRGIELEPEARKLFEMMTDETVSQVGLCVSDDRKIGCSPDGLIGDNGGIEIKCPSMAVHVEYLLGGKVPSYYFQQVQGSLYVTGREYWWFLSYYPGMKPLLIRSERDEKFLSILAKEIALFSEDLEKIVKEIS